MITSLQAVNMPQRLIDLVMSSMAASRVTVMVNCEGYDFITPNWGLRQGCLLSPYLFILSMEFLTKHLELTTQQGFIKGIKLVAMTPKLTHTMYADDLIIMGATNLEEVRQFRATLECFAKY